MCGLAGVISNYVSKGEYDDFLRLLLVSQFRGRHSTGVFSVTEKVGLGKKADINYSLKYFKQAVPSSLFIDGNPKEIDELVDGTDTKVVAGHCRFGTRGALTDENAHPFHFSNITGMHNGTLNKHLGKQRVRPIKGKKGKFEDVEETDSEAFFRFLNDHTLMEALNEIQDTGNAYAFVWYDKRDHTLNFVRNHLRPLWMCSTNQNTLYWASEKEMLEFILNRNMMGYGKNIDELSQIPVDTHIAFDLTAANPSRAYTVTPLKFKREPWSFFKGGENSHNSYRGPVNRGVVQTWNHQQNNTKKNTTKADSESGRGNVITLPVVPKPKLNEIVPNGGFYMIGEKGFTKKEYEHLLEKGCVFCEVQYSTRDPVRWLNYNDYLCPKCLSEPDLASMAIPDFSGSKTGTDDDSAH